MTPADPVPTPADAMPTRGVSASRPGSDIVSGLDTIQLRGLRATGTHGVLAEEKIRAQPFEVDLDLYLDLRAAGRSDALVDTVDYGAVAAAVAAVVAGPHADLLEHLAERIARAATLSVPDAEIRAVTVTVRKLRPPVPVDLAVAGVRIHRWTEELGPDDEPAPSGDPAGRA